MFALTIAAFVSALATLLLNAHAGFNSTKVLPFAILFAALNAAMDLGKSAALYGAVRAAQSRAYDAALLCLILFSLLITNSIWNAVQQVAITRDEGKAERLGSGQTRARLEADYDRLTRALTSLEANQLFTATTSCTLPKTRDAIALCTRYRETKTSHDQIAAQLTASIPVDTEPHVTVLASAFAIPVASIRFWATFAPILIAEILSSVGFYIVARLSGKPPVRPATSVWRRLATRLAAWRPKRSTAPPVASDAASVVPSSQSSSPKMVWKTAPPRAI